MTPADTLGGLDAGPVLGCAGRAAQAAREVAALSRAVEGRRAALATWTGPAASAFAREADALAAVLAPAPTVLTAVALLLRRHAEVVRSARAQTDRLLQTNDDLRAAHALAAVAVPSGIPPPLRRLTVEMRRTELEGELSAVSRRVGELVEEVRADAARTARAVEAETARLRPAGGSGGRSGGAGDAAFVAALPGLAAARRNAGVRPEPRQATAAHGHAGHPVPPPPGTPAVLVEAWWSLLTAAERIRVLAGAPRAVGALAGLPAAVRSAANETALSRDLTALLATPARTRAEQQRLAACLAVARRLAALRAQVDPRTGQPTVAQLWVYRPGAFGGDGRVALAVGDVDTADHVAVLVPGMGSSVAATLPRLTGDAARVRAAATRWSGSRTGTAVVAWVGYDAPTLGTVASPAAARRGGRLLAADLLDLQAARAVPPHLTVVGHSYGSTTVGLALRDRVTGVDDVVLLGSPGAGVDRAAELQVPRGHVFVGASSRDPVSYLDRFGADPTHASFGAVRFRAEDPARNPVMLDIADHSRYFAPGSESLAGVAAVVAGATDQVALAPYRGELPGLPDGISTDPEADRPLGSARGDPRLGSRSW